MFHFADKNLTSRSGNMSLRVALEAKIVVALHEHFGIDRAMRLMTNRAAFPQRLMLENKWPRLIAVTFGTRLVEPPERQPACRFHDVEAMRIMALHAIHLPLDHGMT